MCVAAAIEDGVWAEYRHWIGRSPAEIGERGLRPPARLDERTAAVLAQITGRGYAWLNSPRELAGLIAPLGLVARHAREGGRRGRFYLLDPAVLGDLATRYNPAASEGVGAGLSPETVDNR